MSIAAAGTPVDVNATAGFVSTSPLDTTSDYDFTGQDYVLAAVWHSNSSDTLTGVIADPAGVNASFTRLVAFEHAHTGTYIYFYGLAPATAGISGSKKVRATWTGTHFTYMNIAGYSGASTTQPAATASADTFADAAGVVTVTYSVSTTGNLVALFGITTDSHAGTAGTNLVLRKANTSITNNLFDSNGGMASGSTNFVINGFSAGSFPFYDYVLVELTAGGSGGGVKGFPISILFSGNS